VLSLFEFSRTLGLEPFATAFDVKTQEWLAGHQRILKVASGDNTFIDLLSAAGNAKIPTIVSTGFLAHQQVLDLESWWSRDFSTPLALLHCVSAYPSNPSELNLRSIPNLAQIMPATPIGFSDHSVGITASLAAVALGAFLIEKHFTLNHHQSDFRDHQLSADPNELREIVRGTRAIEQAIGDGFKVVTDNELLQRNSARRSAAARHDLSEGAIVTKSDIVYLRPGGGFSPGREAELLGRTLVRSLKEGQLITESDVM
jgi:sialic acid synthase SpsE